MRRLFASSAVSAIALLAACSGGGTSSQATTTPPAAASAAPSMAAASSPEQSAEAASPESSGQPQPGASATATPNPNLLDVTNGTVLRSYSPASLDRMNDGNLGNAAMGVGSELPPDAKPPYSFTFELPSVATISSFLAGLRDAPAGAGASTLTFAVSTTGPNSGFTDAGTMSLPADSQDRDKTLAVNVRARWVRVTSNGLFNSVGAIGTLAPPPAHLDPTGYYIEDPVPDKDGSFVAGGRAPGDERVRFVAVGPGLTATECTPDGLRAVYIGTLAGRNWTASFAGNKDANPEQIQAVVNDDASIIAGTNGSSKVFIRTTERPKYCSPRVSGSGPHRYLVLDQDPIQPIYPVVAASPPTGYSFSSIGAGMLDAAALNGQEGVITQQACKIPELMGQQQRALLLQWIAAGHKLLLAGGECGTGADFSWLPYPFTSAGPGPESTRAGLIQVENNALGTNDKNDSAHFVDTNAFAADGNNDLASADLMTTTDPHWCGHFFIAKTTNLNGFAQTYAVDGGGLMIYDGFTGDDGQPQLQRIRQLELALPVAADLPCSQSSTESFLLEPSQEATFDAGTAKQVFAEMRLLANQGWAGHASVKATGDLHATVTPSDIDVAGGTTGLRIAIAVPASTKAGVYTVNVVADNGAGKTARASIVLTGNASLNKAVIQKHQRIRIYGIHFDYDSAHIQPRSEPVIAEIAALLRTNPAWQFEVSGHTDSDGGAAYNLGLSQRRAQAVVDDLVNRYGIARSRLVAKGYGLSRPVASNATDAGKALNRRVELERLQ
jgi:outer membrane protein OmpA-like peptidoglycan-associated protein